jgi:hypothetical protein
LREHDRLLRDTAQCYRKAFYSFVNSEPDIEDSPRYALAPLIHNGCPDEPILIALPICVPIFAVLGVNHVDSDVGKSDQFIALGPSVMISVEPQAKAPKYRIACVDSSIVIGIKTLQRFESVCCSCTVGFLCDVTEQFASVVDNSIPVPIPYEESNRRVRAGPGNSLSVACGF